MAKLHKITWFQRISLRSETDKIFSRVHFAGNFIGCHVSEYVIYQRESLLLHLAGASREGHPSLRGIHIRRTRVRTVEQLDKMIAVQFATFQRGRLYTYVAAIEQSVSIVLYRARDPRIYASRRDSAKSFPSSLIYARCTPYDDVVLRGILENSTYFET